MITLHVQQHFLDAIKNGTKSLEGRLAKDIYRSLKAGSVVAFYNEDHTDMVEKKVVSLRVYKTFRDAFLEEDYTKAIPGANTIDEAVAVYEQFYPVAKQNQHGIVFIEIA